MSVAPKAKTATIYRVDGSARLLREDDHIGGGGATARLSIPFAEIFE